MTDPVTKLLHDQADGLDPVIFDVDVLTRAGDRRIRRRRTAWGAGLAAAAVVTAVAIPMAVGAGSDDADPADRDSKSSPFAEAFADQEPSYAVGSKVFIDGRSFDVGREVKSMVQTDVGIVFADAKGGVFAADGSEVERVGSTEREQLRLEADESLVAWVDPTGSRPVFATYDQSSGTAIESKLGSKPGMGYGPDASNPAVVYAVDDDTVYLRDARGAVAWNVASSDEKVLQPDALGFTILDVKGGIFAYDPAKKVDFSGNSTLVGPSLSDGRRLGGQYPDVRGGLSPNGSRALGESQSDTPAVWNTSTQKRLSTPRHDYDFMAGYRWLDNDTFSAIGLNRPFDSARASLLTCSVGGACVDAVKDLPSLDGGLVLPFGEGAD